MPRSTNNPAARKRHKKVLKRASGYRQGRSRLYQFAKQFSEKGLNYAWVGRRNRKRDFRSLWVIRINAAAVSEGMSYSRFMCGLRRAGVTLDRKMLASLAQTDTNAFRELAEISRRNQPPVPGN